MLILRSIIAVIVGYLVIIILVIVTTLVLLKLLPDFSAQPTPFKYVLLNLVYVTVFSVVGGFVTGIIARREQFLHTLVLGFLLGLFGVLSIISAVRAERELWFPITNTALQFFSAVLGGYFSSLKYSNKVNQPKTSKN